MRLSCSGRVESGATLPVPRNTCPSPRPLPAGWAGWFPWPFTTHTLRPGEPPWLLLPCGQSSAADTRRRGGEPFAQPRVDLRVIEQDKMGCLADMQTVLCAKRDTPTAA